MQGSRKQLCETSWRRSRIDLLKIPWQYSAQVLCAAPDNETYRADRIGASPCQPTAAVRT